MDLAYLKKSRRVWLLVTSEEYVFEGNVYWFSGLYKVELDRIEFEIVEKKHLSS